VLVQAVAGNAALPDEINMCISARGAGAPCGRNQDKTTAPEGAVSLITVDIFFTQLYDAVSRTGLARPGRHRESRAMPVPALPPQRTSRRK
jgi:hypothetical protein